MKPNSFELLPNGLVRVFDRAAGIYGLYHTDGRHEDGPLQGMGRDVRAWIQSRHPLTKAHSEALQRLTRACQLVEAREDLRDPETKEAVSKALESVQALR